MYEYKNEIVDFPGLMKAKLNNNDMYMLDDIINKRTTDGWELISTSYSIAASPQVLLTFKRVNNKN